MRTEEEINNYLQFCKNVMRVELARGKGTTEKYKKGKRYVEALEWVLNEQKEGKNV